MKNIFKSLMLVAVAAMGIACQENLEGYAPERANEVVMTITADADETRTWIDEENGKVQWSEGDKLKVIENSAVYRNTEAATIEDGKAKFAVSFPANTSALEYTYNAIFPASAVVEDDAEKIDATKVKVVVKDQQKPTATSFDPQADVLVANQLVFDAQPTELNMQFKRLVAMGKMTLKNMPADAKIAQVVFTAGANDGVAGRNYVNATTGKVLQYGYFGKTNVLTMSYDEAISTRDIYFTCNPFAMEAGETFKVKVVCEDKTYNKDFTIADGRSLTFTEGNLGTFSVDMKDATVETTFSFADGNYVVLAKNDSKYYAMQGVSGGKYMSYSEVTYDGAATFSTEDETLVWTIASVDGGYTFQNNESKYLYWASGNYAYLGDAQTLTITPIDGTNTYYVAVKETPERVLSYNAGSPRFAFYGNKNQVCQLYLVPVVEDTTPRFEVGPETLEFDSNASPLGDDFFTVTAVNGFDITTVTATTDAEWLYIDDAEAADGTYYMCPAKNEGEARTADVVFSAEGLSVTVTVKQQAATGPVYTTVAEFLAAPENETDMYTLKGTITAVANTSYGNFDLTDDTGTVYIYGLMSPDGATNKYWSASKAKLGDDIVIKTIRTSFNNTPQGKNAWFVELVSPGTRAFYTIDPAAVDFASAGGEQDIEVSAYNTTAAVTATSDNDAFAVAVNGYVVTVTAAANELEQDVTGNITIKVGDLEATVVKATLAAKPASGVVEGGSDDFHTIASTNTSYVSGKTTAGWNYKNCAIFQGGTSDASPAFKMIGDASNRALCMNGKTSAVGSITSPTLTTGCGTLTFNYGLPFSDTKIKFRVDIIQNGAVVKTFTVEKSSATKLTLYSHEEVINVAGDFQIVFTNLSPSSSTSNKDRTAIWDVEWTGYAE